VLSVPALSPDSAPNRLAAAIVTAIAVHGMAAAFITFAGRGEPLAATTTAPKIEIDIEEFSSSATAGGQGSEPSSPRETPVRAGSRGSVTGAGRRSLADASSEREPNDTAVPETPYAVDPSRGNAPGVGGAIDLGMAPGSWSQWVDPLASSVPPAPEHARAAPAPVSTTGGLAEALEAHDRAVGLGPAGAVLSAAREAGHSEDAPAIGTAIFSIIVLQTGAVRVELIGASSQVDAWRKVGEHMAANIRRKPPRIDPPRAGVSIELELKAQETWPNGAPAKSEGPALTLSGSIRATDQAKEELARRNPAAVAPPGTPVEQPPLVLNIEPPGLWLKGRGKVCSYQVGLTPLGILATGGCDPSNIGARPMRVVSTRVVSQKTL